MWFILFYEVNDMHVDRIDAKSLKVNVERGKTDKELIVQAFLSYLVSPTSQFNVYRGTEGDISISCQFKSREVVLQETTQNIGSEQAHQKLWNFNFEYRLDKNVARRKNIKSIDIVLTIEEPNIDIKKGSSATILETSVPIYFN